MATNAERGARGGEQRKGACCAGATCGKSDGSARRRGRQSDNNAHACSAAHACSPSDMRPHVGSGGGQTAAAAYSARCSPPACTLTRPPIPPSKLSPELVLNVLAPRAPLLNELVGLDGQVACSARRWGRRTLGRRASGRRRAAHSLRCQTMSPSDFRRLLIPSARTRQALLLVLHCRRTPSELTAQAAGRPAERHV